MFEPEDFWEAGKDPKWIATMKEELTHDQEKSDLVACKNTSRKKSNWCKMGV